MIVAEKLDSTKVVLAIPKIKMLAARKPGEPHTFDIGKEAVARYFKVTEECAQAQRLKVMAQNK